jgi:hypothetical protein
MKKPSYIWAPVLGLVFAVTLNSVASADTITAKLTGLPQFRSAQISADGGATWKGSVAGALQWERVGGTKPGDPIGNFTSFCIELTQNLSIGQTYTFDAVLLGAAPLPGGPGVGNTGMGSAKANLLRELWGRYFGNVNNADTSAAFQVATWEIVYDLGVSLGAGDFQAKGGGNNPSPTYLQTAQNWLNSLDGTGPKAKLGGMSSLRIQDQVYPTIPLPNAVWGGMLLLSGLAVAKVRKAINA